jgi:hypothetical protein
MLLSDIVVLGLALEWYEGVALVQAIVESQLVSGDTVVVPQLQQVKLSADGSVELLGGSASNEPVRRMGQMLQAILSNCDVPVQLRLVASQATAPTPAYSCLQEYADALKFFERPGRTAILQGIYMRAASAADVPPASAAPTLDAIAPLPEKDAPVRREKDDATVRLKRQRVLVAMSAAAVLFAAGAAAKYARTDVGASRLSVLKTHTVQVSDRLGGAVVSAVSEVTDRVGLGRLAPASPQDATAAAPAPTPAKPVAAPHTGNRARTSQPSAAPTVLAFDLDFPVPASLAPVAPVVPARLGLPPRTNSDLMRQLSENVPDVSIYSADSAGVSPPVSIYPQLPRQLPPDIDRGQLGQMELTIALDGTVESAKLVSPPRYVHDSMLLSAAKTWQFRPALKDGTPVRYRKTVWIATR